MISRVNKIDVGCHPVVKKDEKSLRTGLSDLKEGDLVGELPSKDSQLAPSGKYREGFLGLEKYLSSFRDNVTVISDYRQQSGNPDKSQERNNESLAPDSP